MILPGISLAHWSDQKRLRFWSKVIVRDGCWEWSGARNRNGYGTVFLVGQANWGLNKPFTTTAHRVAFALTHGGIPPGLVIRHSCDHPPCCNPAHLLAGTHLENRLDCVQRGRVVVHRGPRTYSPEVLKAALLLSGRGEVAAFARRNGVSINTLRQAVYRERRHQQNGFEVNE